MPDRSFADKASAADKSIGFDYQYYWFLYTLLNLKTGESAGLEVEDDVHVSTAAVNLLFQLKHTVQKSALGKPIALTALDADLWKTLSNWAKIITDPTQGRSSLNKQLDFARRSEFHLVSNKSVSKADSFYKKINGLRNGESLPDVKSYLRSLHTTTDDQAIKDYISEVAALADDVLDVFLKRIHFQLELGDVIRRVKRAIREKVVDEAKVDLVFQRLDSNVRSDNFIAVHEGKQLLVSFDEFIKRYANVFADARSKKLTPIPFSPVLPSDIFGQLFIKRLLEVNDITIDDEEQAVEYTTFKLQISRYLDEWIQSGDLVRDEVEQLHNEVLLRWSNAFKAAFRGCADDSQVVALSLKLLDKLREDYFRIGDTELGARLSNGELYLLSDLGRLGWHRDWEKS